MDFKLLIAMGCLMGGVGIVAMSFTGVDFASIFKFELMKP